MNKTKVIILVILLVILIISIVVLALVFGRGSEEAGVIGPVVTNFEECASAGYNVMESYPRQCRTPDGEIFVEDIGNELEKIDLIRINTPRPNQEITSPLIIEGEARGYWFFEGDFPIELLDENRGVIATSFATAQGEWMTEDFVAFTAELEFETEKVGKAELILEKDNPSGLPENDDSLLVPVIIKMEEE